MDLKTLQQNLERRGFVVHYFATRQEAADYVVALCQGKTVGFGGSVTLQELGVYERLAEVATPYSHWALTDPDERQATLDRAAKAQVFLTSVNGIAETGELINIDGTGNRVASTLYGHEVVCFVAGVNKVAPTFDEALWRARNVAAPLNARRLGKKTPCAVGEEVRCFDCKSPERICNGLTVHWRRMGGVGRTEVVLVGEELGY